MAIYKNANLDISVAAEQNPNYNAKPSVQFSTQDKNTAKYTFTVKQNNKPVDLTGVTASVTLFSEDKSVFQSDANITNATEGKIEYVIPAEAIRHHGKTRGDLRLTYPNGDVLGGLRFSFNIEQALIDRAAGTVGGVYIRDFETLKAEIQATADSIKGIDIVRIDTKLIELEQKVEEGGVGVDEQARQEIQEVSDVVDRKTAYYWTPETQPPARSDIPGYLIDGFNLTADQIVERFIEPYRTANPDYVTRQSLGKDQSGTHDIWAYSFTPKNPKREIVVSSSLHGNEVTLTISMIRLLHYLVNESDKYPLLAQLREEVTIHYIPFANPWGASQKPRTRYNSRGVDLNRNFSHGWDSFASGTPFGHDYKGESAFSEKESQIIRDFMASKSNAAFWLDLHNTGETTRDFYVFLPNNYEPKTYEKLADYFSRDMTNPVVKLDRNAAPTLSNYYYHTHKKPASHPEWCDIRFGQRMFDSVEMTKALEWLTAVIVEHYRESLQVTISSNPVITAGGNYLIEDYFSSGAIAPASITLTTYTLPFGTNTFQVPEDGFVTFNGEVVILSGANGCRATVCPGFGQAGLGGFSHIASKWESYSDVPANTRLAIPFFSSYPVRKTQNNIQGIQYGLHAKADNGSYVIARYRGQFEFTPATNGNHTSRQITPVAQT